MRKLAILPFIVFGVACGGDSNPVVIDAPAQEDAPIDTPPPIDSPPPLDLACATNPTPTTATAQVVLSGAANSIEQSGGIALPTFAALPLADVEACVDQCNGPDSLDTTTSAAAPCPQTGCAFATAALPTGGAPLNGYLTISKTTYRTTHIFPSEPVRADLMNVPALVLSTNAFNFIKTVAGVTQNDNTNGVLAVVVTDCALTPVSGGTLTVTQNGSTPAGVQIVDASAFAAQLAGTFFVFDVPEGITTVGATVDGTTFRPHDIQVFAGETSGTQVTPGFAP